MAYSAHHLAHPGSAHRPWSAVLSANALLAVGITGIAAVLVGRWWLGTERAAAPIGIPFDQYVHQLAGIPVMGLLFIRFATPGSSRTASAQHLNEMAARWAWVWAATTAVQLAVTASRVAGVPIVELPFLDNLLRILASSSAVLTQVTTLWIALIIAMFGARLSGTAPAGALLLVGTAAFLPTGWTGPIGHQTHPGGDFHRLVMVAIAVQVVAAAIWMGSVVTLVVHLRPRPSQLPEVAGRFSAAASVCGLVFGVCAVVQSFLGLGEAGLATSPGGNLVLAQFVALVLLATVGYRHRRRTAHVTCSGKAAPLLALAGGELLFLLATAAAAGLVTIPA